MHGGPNDDTYAMYINSAYKRIAFKTTGTTSAAWFTVDDIDIWDGEWHNITVTYDGTKKVIYVDSIAVATKSDSGSIVSGIGYNLLVGAGRDTETPSLLYKGAIDEVRIYNYALSADEVGKIFNMVQQSPETVYTTESIEICQGSEYFGWTETGTYQRTLIASNGADSVVTAELTVNPTYETTEEITIQKGESYLEWAEEGEYKRVLTSSTGCDSTVTTLLTVEKANDEDKNNPDYDASSKLTPTSETDTITLSKSQSYGGITGAITTEISEIELNNFESDEFIIYPNPARSYINIDYSLLPEMGTTIEILNGNGQVVFNQRIESSKNRIDINHLSPGMYYIRPTNNNRANVKKLVVE